MAEVRKITCIVCPIGCKLSVKVSRDKVKVEGESCRQGPGYAKQEALDPRRIITTTVLVSGGEWPLVSVKTASPVPKEKVFEVLAEIRKARVSAPVTSGQTIIENVAGTGIDVVATKLIVRSKEL